MKIWDYFAKEIILVCFIECKTGREAFKTGLIEVAENMLIEQLMVIFGKITLHLSV
jgi:hypothetical protein